MRSAETGRFVASRRLRGVETRRLDLVGPGLQVSGGHLLPVATGEYTVKVAGTTRDLAGNRWESATCERLLIVK